MFTPEEQSQIHRLWSRRVDQDGRKLPQSERHRNLEPDSAAFVAALAAARVRAKPGIESVTLHVGKGLQVSRFTKGHSP